MNMILENTKLIDVLPLTLTLKIIVAVENISLENECRFGFTCLNMALTGGVRSCEKHYRQPKSIDIFW